MPNPETHLAGVWAPITTLEIETGGGSWIVAKDGTRYLDFTSGIAVTSTGHCHPAVVEAIAKQAHRLIHGQVNCYRHDLLEPLAQRLAEITPNGIDVFYLSNSGSEITESAVKLAKAATGRSNVVVFRGSFHGRTHLAMAMTTSKTGYRSGYANLAGGVFVSPYPDTHAIDTASEVDRCLGALRELLAAETAPSDTAALVVEPILGEGGYIPAPPEFLKGVAAIAHEYKILFVADEVQTGFGRTGKMFAVEHAGIAPDILMMAKGIASGFPMSALGASREIMTKWPPGAHGGTYGGNPMACAASLATIDVLTEPGFLQNVDDRGKQMREGFAAAADHDPGVTQVRGLGMMNAVEFTSSERTTAVLTSLRNDHQVLALTAGTHGNVLRWAPPLIVNREEIDLAVTAFAAALDAT